MSEWGESADAISFAVVLPDLYRSPLVEFIGSRLAQEVWLAMKSVNRSGAHETILRTYKIDGVNAGEVARAVADLLKAHEEFLPPPRL